MKTLSQLHGLKNSFYISTHDDIILSIKSFLHACIIPLLLTLAFHNIFIGLAYLGAVAGVYHYFIQEREEYFLFALGISSIVLFGTFFVGAVGAIG